MNSQTAPSRKPNLRSDNPPERRRTRRTDAAGRVGKAFYRPRPIVTTGDFFDTNFVPGYN